MNYAVIISDGGEMHALIKSMHYERCHAVHELSRQFLRKVLPASQVALSAQQRVNRQVGIHPDRDAIMSSMLALAFPLPVAKDILEGEYRRIK